MTTGSHTMTKNPASTKRPKRPPGDRWASTNRLLPSHCSDSSQITALTVVGLPNSVILGEGCQEASKHSHETLRERCACRVGFQTPECGSGSTSIFLGYEVLRYVLFSLTAGSPEVHVKFKSCARGDDDDRCSAIGCTIRVYRTRQIPFQSWGQIRN